MQTTQEVLTTWGSGVYPLLHTSRYRVISPCVWSFSVASGLGVD